MRLAYTAPMRVTRFLPRLTPAVLLALAGCGQTGALYLPDAGVETPVEVRTTATPSIPVTPAAPVPAPSPALEPDDEEEQSDLPKGL